MSISHSLILDENVEIGPGLLVDLPVAFSSAGQESRPIRPIADGDLRDDHRIADLDVSAELPVRGQYLGAFEPLFAT